MRIIKNNDDDNENNENDNNDENKTMAKDKEHLAFQDHARFALAGFFFSPI